MTRENEKGLRFGKRDIIVIGVLFVFAAAALLMNLIFSGEGSRVEVYLDNELYREAPLNVDSVIDVEEADGVINRIRIENGECFMEAATCRDKLCMGMGHIKRNGENIVCLPHRVVVKVTGGVGDEIDSISG